MNVQCTDAVNHYFPSSPAFSVTHMDYSPFTSALRLKKNLEFGFFAALMQHLSIFPTISKWPFNDGFF